MVQANAKSTTRSGKPRKPRKSKADTLIAEAIAAIKEQRRRGKRISLMTGPTIRAQALELLTSHPEIYTQARAKWEAETKIKLV